MPLLQYLIVLILVAGEPIAVKFKDFDTFASESKLEKQIGCDEFLLLKNRDDYIKKNFKTKKSNSLEAYCITPEQFNEWILTPGKLGSKKIKKLQNKENEIITNDQVKEYTGILRYKEPSKVKSVEAYSSTAFYLEVTGDSSKALPLSSSETVNYETLQKFVNSKVKLTAKYIEQMPNPNESYPLEMTPDGKSKPMLRKFHSVITITLAR